MSDAPIFIAILWYVRFKTSVILSGVTTSTYILDPSSRISIDTLEKTHVLAVEPSLK